ncbi:MAG: lytic transglycosylase domain-containing protein [Ruminococcus sp.]
MAQRYAKKKKHSFLKNVIIMFLSVVVAAGAFYVITQNLSCAQQTIQESIYPIKYREYVDTYSEKYDLDRALVYGVIKTESDFNPEAESHVGAKGLMQLMPESFEWLQGLRKEELDESMILDPETNIDYGCYLLDYFRDYYGDIYTAVAAYNAGFKVGEWLKDSRYSNDGKTLIDIPYKETSQYVKKVKKSEKMYNKLYFSSK